jgi:hypothetical protein
VAAPVIAVVGALAVVRLAQLDIGFARSVTEVAIAEVQEGYRRAHVTRYTALYTSLTKVYDMIFDDPGSLAQPFGTVTDYVRSPHDPTYVVTLRRRRNLFSLHGFHVPSNKTDVLHSEQMCDLGGVFTLVGNESEGYYVKNGTGVSLHDAGVLRRTEEGKIQTAWAGEVEAGSTVRLAFEPAAGGTPHLAQWDQSPATCSYELQAQNVLSRLDRNRDGRLERSEVRGEAKLAEQFDRLDTDRDHLWSHGELIRWCRRSRAGEVSLGQLFERASRGLQLGPGEIRLIGWTAQEMPGITIDPSSAQALRRTMFLVHLRRGALPEPRPDVNRKADVMKVTPDNEAGEGKDVREVLDGLFQR